MSKETQMNVVVLQGARSLPDEVRVEPGVVGVSISDEALEVVIEIGLDGNQAGLELGLEADAASLEVELSVLVKTEGEFVVGKLGAGVSVELHVGLADELSVELPSVIGGVVVIEKAFLAHWLL